MDIRTSSRRRREHYAVAIATIKHTLLRSLLRVDATTDAPCLLPSHGALLTLGSDSLGLLSGYVHSVLVVLVVLVVVMLVVVMLVVLLSLASLGTLWEAFI